MASLKKTASIRDFQNFVGTVYGLANSRLYPSIWDLLTQQQRFSMRTLKGIRKSDMEKVKNNLLITLSWLVSVANRFHIDVEDLVWGRFPGICSYCGKAPCVCKATKRKSRTRLGNRSVARPRTIAGYQEMFRNIYPPEGRSLADAGVHFAEEVGEVSEAIHNYIGLHEEDQFTNIGLEIADVISCTFGIANSANIDVAKELAKKFTHNCHVCHKAPCTCSFAFVTKLKT